MTHKVITDKDGRMQTVPVSDTDAQAAVAKARRELRDMLAGNTQFHADNLGPTPKQPDFSETLPEVHYFDAGWRDRELERIADDMARAWNEVFGIRHA